MTPPVVTGPGAAREPLRQLVLATRNAGKLAELRAALAGLDPPLELLSLDDFPDADTVEETGATLEENARLKALSALQATGLPSLADDTGLHVDALGGEPGVHSARYAGPDGDSAANRAKLLAALEGVPAARRGARFRCVLALASPGPSPGTVECDFVDGIAEGAIAEAPLGSGGFGYDAIFLVGNDGRTMAELSSDEKNLVSHRGRAVRALRAFIELRSRR